MSTPSDPPDRPKHPSSRPPPSRPRKPTDVLLNDEAVIKVIAGVLRKRRIPESEREDMIIAVQTEAMNMPGETPDDLEGWKRRCRALAETSSIDEIRKWLRRSKTHAGLTDREDEHVDPRTERSGLEEPDRAKVRTSILEVVERAKLPGDTLTIARGIAVGMTASEVAREEGMPERRAQRRWSDFTELARKHPVLIALAGVAICWGIVTRVSLVPAGPVAHHDPMPVPSVEPLPNEPEPLPTEVPVTVSPTVSPEAEAMRARAAGYLKKKLWKECLEELGKAQKISPEESATLRDKVRQPCQDGFDREYSAKGR